MRATLAKHWRAPSMAAVPGLLLGLLLGLGLAVALPTSPAAAQGTPAQRAACEQDANRLCINVMPDERLTENCLRRNLTRLSPTCRSAFRGKARKARAHQRSRE